MLENQISDSFERAELPVLAQISPYPIIKKYAVLLFLISIMCTLLMVAFDLMMNSAAKWATLIPSFVLLYLCFKEHQKNDLQTYLPFSRIVKISWLMGLFIAIPIAIFSYLLYTYIAPSVIDQTIEVVRTQMEAQPNSDPEITERIIAWQTKYLLNPTSMSISAMIVLPIMTLLEGMLVGAFIHKAIPRFK